MRLFEEEKGWLFHGTSPLAVSIIRKEGFCQWTRDSELRGASRTPIYFSPYFATALNYSRPHPNSGNFRKLYDFVQEKGFDESPIAMLRVREDDPILDKCAIHRMGPGEWSVSFVCKDRCVKPPTTEVCIIPPNRKRKSLGVGMAKTWNNCKWKKLRF